jgi:hypothetical protein
VWDVLTLRRGAAQLRAERDFAGGHVHRRVRGVPGHPIKVGSLGPPFPRGASHAHHAGAEGAPRGARRRRVDLVTGDAQVALHPLHDDFQQHRVGVGVVVPPQQRACPTLARS